jgi:hypothetical protein
MGEDEAMYRVVEISLLGTILGEVYPVAGHRDEILFNSVPLRAGWYYGIKRFTQCL